MNLSNDSIRLLKDYSYITNDEDYQKLKSIQRHTFTNTYDHSIRVALLTGKIADKLNADQKKAIKAALLHDFCMVDYNKKNDHEGLYIFYHPKEAIENSKKWNLSKEEENAILSHMFPIGRIPTSRIGWSITMADKIVAVYEKIYGVTKIKSIILKIANS
jgi:uncharacterized protein